MSQPQRGMAGKDRAKKVENRERIFTPQTFYELVSVKCAASVGPVRPWSTTGKEGAATTGLKRQASRHANRKSAPLAYAKTTPGVTLVITVRERRTANKVGCGRLVGVSKNFANSWDKLKFHQTPVLPLGSHPSSEPELQQNSQAKISPNSLLALTKFQ